MKNLLNKNHNKYTIALNLSLTILFIILPISAFLLAIITFKNQFSRIIFVLFWGLCGFSKNLIWSHDYTFWTMEFIRYEGTTFRDFVETKILTLGSESTDFIYSLFLFIMSKITNSSAWFWFLTNILFSLLYVKCYTIIFRNYQYNNLYLFILLLIFIFFIPITAYGVRFWFAALIYIYSIVRIITLNDKRYIFILLMSSLIHFSFLIPTGAFVYYQLTKSKQKLYLPIFFTLTIATGAVIQFTQISALFENFTAFDQKIEAYGQDSERVSHYAARSTFLIVDKFAYTLYAFFVVIYTRIQKSGLRSNQINSKAHNFSYFLLIYLAVLLLFIKFPDILDRFTIIFTLITIIYFTYYYLLHFNKFSMSSIRKVNNMILLAIMFWGFHLIVNIAKSRGVIDMKILYSSLFTILSGDTDLQIIY